MISIKIEQKPDELLRDEASWNALSGGVPFRQSSWLDAWHSTFGKNATNAWLVARDASGQTVGVLPLQRAKHRCGRVWKTLGNRKLCTDHVSIHALPEYQSEVAERMADFLIDLQRDPEFGWCQLELEGVAAGDPAMRLFLTRLQQRSVGLHIRSRMSVWFRSCAGSWSRFLANCSKKYRATQKQLIRRFEEPENGLSLHYPDTPEEVKQTLDELIRLHQLRWQSQGERGSYADPKMVQFIHQVAQDSLRRGRLSMPTLRKRNDVTGIIEVVATQLNLIGDDDRHYCYSTATDYRYSKLSLGSILVALVLKNLNDQQSPGIDWLRGDEIYKQRSGAASIPLLQVNCFAPTVQGWVAQQIANVKFKMLQTIRRYRRRPLVLSWSVDDAFSDQWQDHLPQSENESATLDDASSSIETQPHANTAAILPAMCSPGPCDLPPVISS